MTKGFAVALLPLFLIGCGEDQHDVAYYLKNEAARKTTLAACAPLPRAGMDQPNCVNATIANKEAAIEGLKELAKTRVRLMLKDPESARFSYVRYQEGSHYICGYVNAKNSYGGYVGDRTFVVGDGQAILGDGEGDAYPDEYIAKACGDQ